MTLREWFKSEHPLLAKGERIRTIGLYQPFATLMGHGKVETRWVMKGRRPPFPMGWYVMYSTKRAYSLPELKDISGRHVSWIEEVVKRSPTLELNGYALFVGELYHTTKMSRDMEVETFVQHKERETHDLWAMRFKNVRALEPRKWEHGKQGIGFLPEQEYENIMMART